MEIGLLRAVTTVVLDDDVETNALVARGNPATARAVMEDNTLIVSTGLWNVSQHLLVEK